MTHGFRRDRNNPVPGNGIFPDRNVSIRFRDVTDGTSQTIMMGERPSEGNHVTPWWAAASGYDGHGLGDQVLDSSEGLRPGVSGTTGLHGTHWWSIHTGGTQFLLADGSSHFISNSIDHRTLLNLSNRKDGEVIGEF